MANTRFNPQLKKLQPAQSMTAAAMSLNQGYSDSYLSRRETDIILSGESDSQVSLAWYYYSKIPELRYIARYISNALSQARLYIGEVTSDPTTPNPITNHPAVELLESFAGGVPGQSELLDRLGMHLTITGDSVIGGPREGMSSDYPFEQWRVFSINEITSRMGEKFYRKIDGREELVPFSASAFRVWRPHPRYHWMADSPTRSSFTVLREIDLLDQHVHASAVSRLAGAGLLLVPDDITFPSEEVETQGEEVDPFVQFITEVMSIAIKNRESAAAMVPIILRGAGEAIDKIRHLTFSTPFDEKVPELRTVALRRLALGMDILPEILLGFSDSNSWSAWQTDESTLRLHVSPLLGLISGALTQEWLRKTPESVPMTDRQIRRLENLVVWYDLSNLRVKPDIVQDAQNLYDRLEIDGDQLRHTAGFSDSSTPNADELAYQICLTLIRTGSPLAPYAINSLRAMNKVNLPKATDVLAEGVSSGGTPSENGSRQDQASVGSNLPGQRSFDKQTIVLIPDSTDPDPNNNATGSP